jgi:DNA-binding CsgD family transcriptional regulator
MRDLLNVDVGQEAVVLDLPEFSYQLSDLPDRASYLAAAARCIRTAVPGDIVALGWTAVDLSTGPPTAEPDSIWFDPPDVQLSIEAHAAVMSDHPVPLSYLANPRNITPRRISDCSSDLAWRNTRTYQEVFHPMGSRHELAIVTPTGRSWFITRAGPDFSDADVTMASGLQPILTILDQFYSASGVHAVGGDGAQVEEARQRAGLTVRELDVLTLLAVGYSAQQIARLRRISPRTVRKHLEHVYSKLDSHDRLLAVNKAHALGMLG